MTTAPQCIFSVPLALQLLSRRRRSRWIRPLGCHRHGARGRGVKVSWEATKHVLYQSNATGSDRLVLLTLACMADSRKGHSCYPGLNYLAERTKMTPHNVQKCLRRLKQSGQITIIAGGGTSTKTGPTNKYIYAFQGASVEMPLGDRGISGNAVAASREDDRGIPCDAQIPRESKVEQGFVLPDGSAGKKGMFGKFTPEQIVELTTKERPPKQTVIFDGRRDYEDDATKPDRIREQIRRARGAR